MAVTDEMVCFSLYAATRATTQAYRSLLEPWGLTYPQYLVLVTLWLEGDQTVSSLGEHLQLDSGTLSPLLKRMEQGGLVRRERRRHQIGDDHLFDRHPRADVDAVGMDDDFEGALAEGVTMGDPREAE